MYTESGSFFEVIAFLEGYAVGSNLDEKEYHSPTTPFRKWVACKFRSHGPIAEDWENAFPVSWTEFVAFFPSESEALSSTAQLYLEYCNFRTENG